MTAVNDEGGEINVATDTFGEDTIPRTMQKYKAREETFMLVVDENCELHTILRSWSSAEHGGEAEALQMEKAQHESMRHFNRDTTAAL